MKEKFKREFKELDGVLVENTVEKVIGVFFMRSGTRKTIPAMTVVVIR